MRQWWRWARLDDRRWAARRVSWDEVLKVGGSHQQLPTPPFYPQMSRRTTSVTSDGTPISFSLETRMLTKIGRKDSNKTREFHGNIFRAIQRESLTATKWFEGWRKPSTVTDTSILPSNPSRPHLICHLSYIFHLLMTCPRCYDTCRSKDSNKTRVFDGSIFRASHQESLTVIPNWFGSQHCSIGTLHAIVQPPLSLWLQLSCAVCRQPENPFALSVPVLNAARMGPLRFELKEAVWKMDTMLNSVVFPENQIWQCWCD